MCGENFQPSNEDRSVTANCSVDIPAGRYVIVQQNARGDEGVSISEMEIYTYGEQVYFFYYVCRVFTSTVLA